MTDSRVGDEMRLYEWLGVSFAVPRSWEILRHSVNPREGALMFADRRMQRLTLSWTCFDCRPDLGQMIRDQRGRDGHTWPEARFTGLTCPGPWKGYWWHDGRQVLCRAGFFDAIYLRWIEMVLCFPEQFDEPLAHGILQACTSVDRKDNGYCWRAFDIAMKSPPRWRLDGAQVRAADLCMRFSFGSARAAVRRLKMAGEWYDGSPRHFIVRQIGAAVNPYFSTRRYLSHDACACRSSEKSILPGWLSGTRRIRRDLLWHCPETDTVYQVTTHGTREMPEIEPDVFVVNCCPGKEA